MERLKEGGRGTGRKETLADNNNNNNNNNNIIIIIIYGIYIALYPDAQSALQHFVRDFARLVI